MNGTASRRTFLKTAAAVTASMTSFSSQAKSARRKPNLLFLWTDEQRPDTIDVYGNRKIQTPNLAKLASESAVFRNAYVSQPVCTPSRATVMTGLWPHQSGCMENNVALSEKVPVLPEIVGDPDYRTGYFGKWHLGDEIFPQHGFQEWRSTEDGYWKYYRSGRNAEQMSSYTEWLKGLGVKPDTSRGEISRGLSVRLPIEQGKPKYLEQEACDFLRRHHDEPFMLYVNFLQPHMPFYGPLNGLYRPEDVDLPTNFNDPLEDNEPLSYRIRQKKFTDGLYQKEFDLTKESGWRKLIAYYWGAVTQVDRSVGGILNTLEELGLADDTIVVYTSDHGDMMGAHHLVEKGYMYQEAMRVPWMIRAPQLGRKQHIIDGHVSHIDLVPTLLDLMQVNSEVGLPGRSLAPALTRGKPASEPVFIQWNAPGIADLDSNASGAKRNPSAKLGPSSRAIIAPDGWKLCLYDNDLNQLFNLSKDPGETTNVYDRPENQPIIRHLDAQIRKWQKRVKDPLHLPARA
ncbi:MAG: sulfatase-like hydrolase/transferase [Candidatus Hydrogenedentes bacterium]|nr:sulfatase-like hydrolase/transferase [Candidatus Hydrogenedentota bacterium]